MLFICPEPMPQLNPHESMQSICPACCIILAALIPPAVKPFLLRQKSAIINMSDLLLTYSATSFISSKSAKVSNLIASTFISRNISQIILYSSTALPSDSAFSLIGPISPAT